MTTSRKTLIINQYIRICKIIESKIDKRVLLNIEDYDIVDLVTLFSYHFLDVNDQNYKEKIDTTIALQNDIELTKSELEIIYPINFNIINNGIIMYYLDYNTKCVPNTITISGNKTTTYIFPNVYNLSSDLYYNMIFNNIITESKNNNLNACDYKIAINAISNCKNFANEFNTYTHCVLIKDRDLTISNLNFIFTDRYNDLITSSLHWSMTLEYEFY